MTADTDTLWKSVLIDIESEVSKANFFTLFKSTALLSLEENIATIAAPSAMIINLLQKRYLPVIKAALEKHAQESVDIMFVPKAIISPKKTEEEGPLFSKPTTPVTKPVGHLPRVRPDFTFQTLAVSQSNQLAYVSSQTVSQNVGQTYNPLFMYGPVGVGKTHLMQAIANEVYTKNPDAKIIYITSEEFTNEVVEAIRSGDTARMKRRFRSATLLIIDDVQFIAGKDRVQEELFHTFNTLIDQGGQIVLSSDRPPSEIKKLEARLSSRFAGGLTVDIESPDFEMRTAIILKKAEKFGFPISIEVAKAIAEKEQDVRSLEGALLRVFTQSTTSHHELTPEFATRTLHGDNQEESHAFHSEDIIDSACRYYNIKPTQLKGPKRDASLVRARQITMYLLKKELGLTFVEIGNVLGGRDHTTVMHGVEKVEIMLENLPTLHNDIQGITKMLRG
ncbi:MAG: chromosomal replication initiator protein DnaA [Patescibacteria group bacterium]|nr:chromosomal replication initiator protein DnaA [Patescibacteria group bacterium]MDE2588742.1 chromosomal replication initiator protein DnaA [Patescibacteria group bacterium]